MPKKGITKIAAMALTASAALASPAAMAGRVETSFGFSFNRTNYGEDSFQWQRRWGASFGYHFTESTEIELSYQDVVNRTQISGYEDTTFHDKIYSVNWVQSLLGKKFILDPYFKVGVGQLNRDAIGSYASGGRPTSQVDSVTGILGAGLRIQINRATGIRCEANSYLTQGRISSWKDNVAFNAGFSIYY